VSLSHEPNPRSAIHWRTTLFFILCGTFIQSLFLFTFETDAQIKTNLLAQCLLLAVFGAWSRRRSGTYLSAPFLFPLAIFFWHSTFLVGHYWRLAEIFDYTGNVFSYGFGHVPRTVALIGFCITGAIAGTVLADWRLGSRRHIGPAVSAVCWTKQGRNLAAAVFSFFFLLTTVYLLFEGINTFDLGYMSLYTDESGSILYRIFQSTKFFCVAAILMLFASRDSNTSRVWALWATFGLIFVNVLMGSRSMPFIYALALIVAVDAFWRRFGILELAAMSVFASASSYIIDHTREAGLGFHIFDFASTGRDVDFVHIFWNSGSVVKTVLRTIEFSTSSGLIYGRSFFDALVYLIPRPIVDGLGFRTGFVTPSVWLIEQSGDLSFGEGLGYSLVAESYLNFGWLGALIFVPLGVFVGWHYLDGKERKDSFSLLLAYNVAILYSLHMRNEVGTYLRAIVYGYILIELTRRICARGRAQASRPETPT
jgi:hypothetical protein